MNEKKNQMQELWTNNYLYIRECILCEVRIYWQDCMYADTCVCVCVCVVCVYLYSVYMNVHTHVSVSMCAYMCKLVLLYLSIHR